MQKLYDKMLVEVEKQMNQELNMAQRKNGVENVELDTIRKAQSMLWRKQFQGTDPKNSNETRKEAMQSMSDYMKTRHQNLQSLETKEQGLIEKLKNTQ